MCEISPTRGICFLDAASKKAESEVAYIDVDTEIVSTKSIAYMDSPEPFDKERELRIDRENRELWQNELTRLQKSTNRNWRLFVVTEWTVGISMMAGFMLLIAFAIFNTSRSVPWPR